MNSNIVNSKSDKIKKIFTNQSFKLEKKWRFWRPFKQIFLTSKKINFYKKLDWNFNNRRLIWHQLLDLYIPKTKNLLIKYRKKVGHNKFYFFIRKLELRLSIVLLRARFFYKLINCYNAIKMNLILVNGIIINKVNFILELLDLFQKRRSNLCQIFFNKKKRRISRLKWRVFRWKKARFLLWKVRRNSHFNIHWSRKQNNFLNYLEINYKIPAGIIIKQPFIKELLLNKQSLLFTNLLLKKIYFLY